MTITDVQCTVCGFVYREDGQTQMSDRLSAFAQLPPTWRCPACGVLKNLFKEVDLGQNTAVNQEGDQKNTK
jgi:rubredoxin